LVGVCTNCFEVGLRSFHSLGVSLFGSIDVRSTVRGDTDSIDEIFTPI
jgi:hypothetical protein